DRLKPRPTSKPGGDETPPPPVTTTPTASPSPTTPSLRDWQRSAKGLTDKVRISGNYDTGAHGPWASLSYNRSVRITPVRNTVNSWNVTLTDSGTFTTLKGKKSPGAGTEIETAVKGQFSG